MKRAPTYEQLIAQESAFAHLQAMALRLLHARQFSEQGLAEHMRISRGKLQKMLRGERDITIKQAASMFNYLGEKLEITCAGIERLDQVACEKYAAARSEAAGTKSVSQPTGDARKETKDSTNG